MHDAADDTAIVDRALPRVSVGGYGAIFENWASVSKKRSGSIGASFRKL
jgi:hypothetical protein